MVMVGGGPMEALILGPPCWKGDCLEREASVEILARECVERGRKN